MRRARRDETRRVSKGASAGGASGVVGGHRRWAGGAGKGQRDSQHTKATSRLVHRTHDGGWTWLGRRGHGEGERARPAQLDLDSPRSASAAARAHPPSPLRVLPYHSRATPYPILGFTQIDLNPHKGESEMLEKSTTCIPSPLASALSLSRSRFFCLSTPGQYGPAQGIPRCCEKASPPARVCHPTRRDRVVPLGPTCKSLFVVLCPASP